MKKNILCLMLILAMSLMAACGSSRNETTARETTARETTMAPTTASTNGTGTGPTSGTDNMESTGVIGGMADDVKNGAKDVMDGVGNALDMTTTAAQ